MTEDRIEAIAHNVAAYEDYRRRGGCADVETWAEWWGLSAEDSALFERTVAAGEVR